MYFIQPLINGKSYEWGDIVVNIMGVPIVGIQSIEYSEEQDITNIYGAGRFPISRGYGKVEPTAKITLLAEEVYNIMSIAPLGRLMDIPEFDIIVTFNDASLVTKVHKLRNARFKNNKISSSASDTSIPVELDLVISHIDWQ